MRWNSDTNQVQVARIAARTIEVEANPLAAPVQPPVQIARNEVTDSEAGPVVTKVDSEAGSEARYDWLVIFLGLGWFVTAVGWWLSLRARNPGKVPLHTVKPMKSGVTAELKQACEASDAEAASHEVINWARAYWPEGPPHSLGEISRRVNDSTFSMELKHLERVRFSSANNEWSGAALLHSLQQFTKSQSAINTSEIIASLHPQ